MIIVVKQNQTGRSDSLHLFFQIANRLNARFAFSLMCGVRPKEESLQKMFNSLRYSNGLESVSGEVTVQYLQKQTVFDFGYYWRNLQFVMHKIRYQVFVTSHNLCCMFIPHHTPDFALYIIDQSFCNRIHRLNFASQLEGNLLQNAFCSELAILDKRNERHSFSNSFYLNDARAKRIVPTDIAGFLQELTQSQLHELAFLRYLWKYSLFKCCCKKRGKENKDFKNKPFCRFMLLAIYSLAMFLPKFVGAGLQYAVFTMIVRNYFMYGMDEKVEPTGTVSMFENLYLISMFISMTTA